MREEEEEEEEEELQQAHTHTYVYLHLDLFRQQKGDNNGEGGKAGCKKHAEVADINGHAKRLQHPVHDG